MASTTAANAESRSPSGMGTIFESSHLPLHLWLQIIHLMCASKKGRFDQSNPAHSSMQHENRLVPHSPHPRSNARRLLLLPWAALAAIVEIDETYIGRKEGFEVQRGGGHKNAVLTLVERGGSTAQLPRQARPPRGHRPYRSRQTSPVRARLMTDEAQLLRQDRQRVSRRHHSVDDSRGEYGWTDFVTGDFDVHQQHRRGLFLDLQARHDRRLSALQ